MIEISATIANIGRAFIRFYPILRVGLFVADILAATNIALKAITSGISSVTAGEWTQLALITATAFFGGKAARKIAKSLIRRALKIPAGTLRSFKSFGSFVKSKGILLEIDDMIVFNRKGLRAFGDFDFVGSGLNTKPIITLHKDGHNAATLIHEFIHYHQWKYFVGGLSRADWQNFINIPGYYDHLDDVAKFVKDVFLK